MRFFFSKCKTTLRSSVLATCLFLAAQQYQIPPAVLIGILHTEGGKAGQAVGPNKNGTYDLGPMQINTIWLDELSKKWNVPKATARRWVQDDACVNVGVAAWILRQKVNETGALSKGIAYYHSATPHIGRRYWRKVMGNMKTAGLIR